MVKMSVRYTGQKHCELTHGPSGTQIETDAPKDNAGRGERFSPSDLLGASLASCALTTIAIVAERDGISVEGATAEVVKEMNPQPRRVAALPVKITLPSSIPAEHRKKLETAGHQCPVALSLHPEVKALMMFTYV